jgi:hypothetical protein
MVTHGWLRSVTAAVAAVVAVVAVWTAISAAIVEVFADFGSFKIGDLAILFFLKIMATIAARTNELDTNILAVKLVAVTAF